MTIELKRCSCHCCDEERYATSWYYSRPRRYRCLPAKL